MKAQARSTDRSEVAALLQHIEKEYEAARNGLTGFAQGAARHAWITAKMERLTQAHERLCTAVGTEQARQPPKALLQMSGRHLRDSSLKTQKGWYHMSSTENLNEQGMEGDPPKQQLTGEQAAALQQLLRSQSDIEGQGQRVARALNPIAEALDNGGNVSLEMVNHVKAQILLAHLHLDELEQVLALIDEQLTGKSVTQLPTSTRDGSERP